MCIKEALIWWNTIIDVVAHIAYAHARVLLCASYARFIQ